MKKIGILGSTGSIGIQALDIIKKGGKDGSRKKGAIISLTFAISLT